MRDPTHKEYDAWDIKIAAAYHIYNDLMRGNVPIYWDESDRVTFDVKTGISKSRAAIDRREEQAQKQKKSQYGVYYYAVPRTVDDGPLPTFEEWAEEKRAKQGNTEAR